MLSENLTTFKKFFELSSPPKDGKAGAFVGILQNHGECQLFVSGASSDKKTGAVGIFTIHLGDEGFLDETMIHFRDRDGSGWWLAWEDVVSLQMHLGYKEQ